MKVLIVEDSAMTLLLFRAMMKKGNHQFTIARNGEEACEVLAKEVFEVIVTDWMMPKMNGEQLLFHIKANIQPKPFIIVISALSIKREVLLAGADEFFEKPIRTDMFDAALSRAHHKINAMKIYGQSPAVKNSMSIGNNT